MHFGSKPCRAGPAAGGRPSRPHHPPLRAKHLLSEPGARALRQAKGKATSARAVLRPRGAFGVRRANTPLRDASGSGRRHPKPKPAARKGRRCNEGRAHKLLRFSKGMLANWTDLLDAHNDNLLAVEAVRLARAQPWVFHGAAWQPFASRPPRKSPCTISDRCLLPPGWPTAITYPRGGMRAQQ